MQGRLIKMPDKTLCLSGSGLTKVFGFGSQRTVAVDHVDFNFYESEIISIVGCGAEWVLAWRLIS